MSSRLVNFAGQDRQRLVEFLEADRVANLAMLHRVTSVNSWADTIWAFERDGELRAAFLMAGNIVLAGQDDDAWAGFVEHCPRAKVGSILGPEHAVAHFYEALSRRWGRHWVRPRNIRYRQPLMVWTGQADIEPEPRMQRLGEDVYDSYLKASVHMYTEEIGVNPMVYGSSYPDAARFRLAAGLAFGVVVDGRVLFKADLGIIYHDSAQIQGVWLDPSLRGRGLAAPAMLAASKLAATRYPNLSLYVNEFNTPAIKSYQRSGFVQVGTMATIHY